ncbi:putative zinc transporter zrg17 [Neolecta irregularis DAH-3]|uniref:Putative zinc transporter zrg17 n=1 Tax=Neolecta irregularis (strain DAH-3) TaxID=1198029 RepID=A0A1U7LVM6_NEOID|nr:putative zinc transporter zrg17 [Neolecta irregularis DAH-3]|eukprot:OLL26679.1 putative zinc transporter zrg17 [Neolecta irregularis DAH-3]
MSAPNHLVNHLNPHNHDHLAHDVEFSSSPSKLEDHSGHFKPRGLNLIYPDIPSTPPTSPPTLGHQGQAEFAVPISRRSGPDIRENGFLIQPSPTPELLSQPNTPHMNVFNFTSTLTSAPMVRKTDGAAFRKGHKHAASSVSHNLFLPPTTTRTQPTLPLALPTPTFKECAQNMTTRQKIRIFVGALHILAAIMIWRESEYSLSSSALGYFVLFDALSSLVGTWGVIMANFKVWRESTLTNSYGLQRREVLLEFSLASSLLFMGIYVVKEITEHWVIRFSIGDIYPTTLSDRPAGEPSTVKFSIMLGILSTVCSMIFCNNHSRFAKYIRLPAISSLPSFFSNAFHLATLSSSIILLLAPLFGTSAEHPLDICLASVIAAQMCTFGYQLAKVLGGMLLMTYPNRDVTTCVRELSHDSNIVSIEQCEIWQPHHDICVANVFARVKGGDNAEKHARERITKIIRDNLGGGYGAGGNAKWEVTVETERVY